MEWQFRLNWAALVEEAKQRRKAQKLTQQRLAVLANISTPTVSRFESGEQRIELLSVLNILEVLGMLDRRNLVFSEIQASKDIRSRVIIFFGQDGDREIRCAISFNVLNDYFHGDGRDELRVFEDNRREIEYEARRKYLSNQLEADGSILIRSGDLR